MAGVGLFFPDPAAPERPGLQRVRPLAPAEVLGA